MTAAAEPIVIEMPLPASDSGGNARAHHIAVWRARKAEKRHIATVLREAGLRDLGWFPVTITLDWYGWNRADPDNIVSRAKGYTDGLVLAGLIPDDGPDHVRINVRHVEIDRKHPRLIVTVERTTT